MWNRQSEGWNRWHQNPSGFLQHPPGFCQVFVSHPQGVSKIFYIKYTRKALNPAYCIGWYYVFALTWKSEEQLVARWVSTVLSEDEDQMGSSRSLEELDSKPGSNSKSSSRRRWARSDSACPGGWTWTLPRSWFFIGSRKWVGKAWCGFIPNLLSTEIAIN